MQALAAAQQHSDLAKVDTVAGIVSSLDQQLKATQKEAEQLNAREGLLGKPLTDYSNIKQLADQFDPFIQFWTATATWKVRTQSPYLPGFTACYNCMTAAILQHGSMGSL